MNVYEHPVFRVAKVVELSPLPKPERLQQIPSEVEALLEQQNQGFEDEDVLVDDLRNEDLEPPLNRYARLGELEKVEKNIQ